MGLLEKGAKVDVVGGNKWTPLHSAAYIGNIEEANILLKKGADVSAVCLSGRTALFIAAWKGHAAVASALLEVGANIEAVGNSGRTPLHVAADEGNEDMVSLLLKKGASLRAKNIRGQTALHIAANKEHVGVVEVLLRMGADVHAVDNRGKTALCYAEKINNAQLKKILKDFSSQQKPVMLEEAETSQPSCLLKQGEGVKVLDIPNAEKVNLTEKKDQQLEAVDLADKERQIVFDVTAKKENEEVEKFLVDASSPLLRREYFNSDKVSIQPRALQEEEFVCSNDSLRFSLTRASHVNQPSFSGVVSQVQELYFCDGHFVVRPLKYGEQVEDCIESEEEGFLWVGPSKPGC